MTPKIKLQSIAKEVNVHFEYTNFWDKDEEIFRNAKNMTALKKIFKQKITIVGSKGKTTKKAAKE